MSKKPRLGDHFATVNWSDIYDLLTTHSITTFRLGLHVFQLPTVSCEIRLSMREVELAGDARAFGALKYQRIRNGWDEVPEDHHLQSAGRHFDAWLRNDDSLDTESGVPHEGHFLARAARIIEMREARRPPHRPPCSPAVTTEVVHVPAQTVEVDRAFMDKLDKSLKRIRARKAKGTK